MNCNIFKENIVNLFDENISCEEKDEMLQHIEKCSYCRHEYEEMKSVMSEIKPQIKIKASRELKSKIMEQLKTSVNMDTQEKGKIIKFRMPVWAKAAAIAAVILIAVIIAPFIKLNSSDTSGEVYAANALFDKSIAAMSNLKTIYLNLNIRTLVRDNFDLIEMDSDFVKNEIRENFSSPRKWKMEKQGLTVLMDGKNQYKYIKDDIALKADTNYGFVEWLQILLKPTLIMENEKKFSKENNAKYTIDETGDKVVLTVKAKALGNFKNDYMLNKTILESNNTRIYTFDKETNLLLSLQVYIEKNNKDVLVLDTKEIKYNINIPDETFSIKLPEGMSWTDVKTLEPSKSDNMKKIASEDAAKIFFEGLENNDWDKVKNVYSLPLNNETKAYYGGLKIISIGKAFKSGLYPGEFVPYEIKLKSGETAKANLAIRNDNKEKLWQVDGGF